MGNCFGKSKQEEKEQLDYHPLPQETVDDNRVEEDDQQETVNTDNIISSVGNTPTFVETSEVVEIESEQSELEKSKPLSQTGSSPSKDHGHLLETFKVKTLDTDGAADGKGAVAAGGSKSK